MNLVDQILPATVDLRLVAGKDAGGGRISVGGVVQQARWINSVRTVPGDDLQILYLDYPTAQSVALVIGRSGRPIDDEGTVTAVGSNTVTLNINGNTQEANFLASYTPAVGDYVKLLWSGPMCTVLGVIGASAPRPPAPTGESAGTRPPPPPKQSGRDTFTASDSGTWSGGLYRWNTYYKSDVYQGTWGGVSCWGAWFYHGKPKRLDGKTIERIRLRLPPRTNSGAYNDAGDLHVYLHTSERRPNGDVNRDWSTDIRIPGSYNGGLVDLPVGWGNKLLSGYGIGIAGNPYMGFPGVNRRANSGQIIFDWRS